MSKCDFLQHTKRGIMPAGTPTRPCLLFNPLAHVFTTIRMQELNEDTFM